METDAAAADGGGGDVARGLRALIAEQPSASTAEGRPCRTHAKLHRRGQPWRYVAADGAVGCRAGVRPRPASHRPASQRATSAEFRRASKPKRERDRVEVGEPRP